MSKIQLEQRKINLDSLAQKVNIMEKELSLKSEDFKSAFNMKMVTWQDIQKSLKKDQVAIEVIRVNMWSMEEYYKDSIVYMFLIIRKDSPYPQTIVLPNGDSLEKYFFTNYIRCIKNKLYDSDSYNVFWKPLSKQLKGMKTVYFSPEGIYHQINLSTLQNPETKKYVSDEIQIINVTNTKDILQKRSYITKNNYLIGNPKFNFGINTTNNEKPMEQRSIENISQLEGAEKEVKEVGNLLKNAQVIIGEEATEEYIKSIKNPRILHIATHGYFRKGKYQSDIQAMLNAGLLLAGVVDYDKMAIRPYDKDDGKLTAFEVMNMELDGTELVVLSACETGLGQTSKDGVYGLQRAFKVAGAQCIIISLWKVNDDATQLLMVKFYENWQKKGMEKRKAFETAQKELRKQFKEPYYWGAFVMIE
jgi:CHAT domain-containing protein